MNSNRTAISSRTAFWWAILSHLLSAVFPYLASYTIEVQGALNGASIIYLTASLLLLAITAFSKKLRFETIRTFKLFFGQRSSSSRALKFSILFYTASALFYYTGLQALSGTTEEITAFSYLTKLQAILAVFFGFYLLKENRNVQRLQYLGVIFIFGSFIYILSSGLGWHHQASIFALLYIITAVPGETLATWLLNPEREFIKAEGLFAVRIFIPAIFLTIAAAVFTKAPDSLSYEHITPGIIILTGTCLPAIFFTRFAALGKGLPLWQYSALSPLRSFVRLIIVLPFQGLTAGICSAYIVFITGEIMIFRPHKVQKKKTA
jgi:hypothetical protein